MRTKLIPSPHIEVQVCKCVCVPSTRRTGVEVCTYPAQGGQVWKHVHISSMGRRDSRILGLTAQPGLSKW